MLKIRRPLGRLLFNMGIAIPGKTVFLIETAPWRQIDDKPLYEPIMAYIYFIDGYMRYSPLKLMCAAYICIFIWVPRHILLIWIDFNPNMDK